MIAADDVFVLLLHINNPPFLCFHHILWLIIKNVIISRIFIALKIIFCYYN